MKRQIVLLVSIVIFGGLLRFWQLTTVPPSLYWDEVSQAYNAYSILETGKDEHQEFLPIARFIAFGDYKAPINIYLTVPSLFLFGKNDFAVRFPSAFLGTLTIIVTYFLVRELFYKYSSKDRIALFASLFLAVSPWHIQLSRAAYEGNIATFFTVCAVLLFLYALRKNAWILIGSALCFVIGFYSFNAQRVFIPLFVFFLAVLFFRKILQIKKQVILSAIVALLLLLPYVIFFQTPESRLRFNEVNIFSDIGTVQKSNSLIQDEESSLFAKVIHNRRVLFAREYIMNYFDFFNPTYLFFEGDINPRFSHRFNGQLHLWIVPFLLVGVYSLFKAKERNAFLLSGWMILAPIAAATARETPHALRSETFIPTFEILAALGASSLFSLLYLRIKRFAPFVIILSGIVIAYSVAAFWHNYTVHNPKAFSTDWQFGYRETVEYVKTIEDQYDQIYFTSTYGRPSIYIAWYGNILPQEYWKSVRQVKDSVGLYTVVGLGKYQFVESPPQNVQGNVLYVFPQEMVPSTAHVLKTFSFLNGQSAFVIAEENK